MVPGYIIAWRPPASCGRRNCTEFNPSTGQGDTPISSTGCTCFLIDGWVEGQYVTENETNETSFPNIGSLKTAIEEKLNKMSEEFILKAYK